MKKIILLVSLVASWGVAAETTLEVHLKKDLPQALTQSPLEPQFDIKKHAAQTLALLKHFESKKNFNECQKLAPTLLQKEKEIRGWIALSWLRCVSGQTPVATIEKIASYPEIFEKGAWRASLVSAWEEQAMEALDAQVKKKAVLKKYLNTLLTYGDKLSRENRSNVFKLLGDEAFAEKKNQQALFYYQQSLDNKDNAGAAEKIRFIKKALNLNSTASDKLSVSDEKNYVIFPENQIEDRMNAALKRGESYAALKDLNEILNNYPGSKTARRLKDRPIEIYQMLVGKNLNTENAVADKAIEVLAEADFSRLVDWATQLHRRADYRAALALAAQALVKSPGSPQSTQLLWIAGRSAQFTGQYELALKYFDELIQKHRGSDEALEATFRSGLVYFRLKNDKSASVFFEKLLFEKKGNYELSAKYWLYRSLQRAKDARAIAIGEDLIQNFPFSYYGIRLRAEQNQNKVSWPQSTVKVEEQTPTLEPIWLEGYQVGAWKRFVLLAKNGWATEAQAELGDLPKMQSPAQQLIFAQKLSEIGLPHLAIKITNEIIEQDPQLRRKEILQYTFPVTFIKEYKVEGDKYGIDPLLLMSLTRQESAFNARAVSTSNAMGLMQMIPPTAKEIAQKLGYKISLPEDMFRPAINIPMGSSYVADMLKQFNNSVPFALAAYNAGPQRVGIWSAARSELQMFLQNPSSLPEDEIWFDELPWTETSFYVKAILRNTLLYKLLEKGEFELSPVLWSDLLLSKTPKSAVR